MKLRKNHLLPVRLNCGHDKLVTLSSYYGGFAMCALCKKEGAKHWWWRSRYIERLLKLRAASARAYATCGS